MIYSNINLNQLFVHLLPQQYAQHCKKKTRRDSRSAEWWKINKSKEWNKKHHSQINVLLKNRIPRWHLWQRQSIDTSEIVNKDRLVTWSTKSFLHTTEQIDWQNESNYQPIFNVDGAFHISRTEAASAKRFFPHFTDISNRSKTFATKHQSITLIIIEWKAWAEN